MIYKKLLIMPAILLACILSSAGLVSCDEFVEYPENIGCGTEIMLSAEICSDNFSSEDITSENPLGTVKITIPYSGNAYGGYDRKLMDTNGLLTGFYPPIWMTKPVKFIVWWPASARIVYGEEGSIVSISDDCKLIGESEVYTVKPDNVKIILKDHHP